MIFVIIQYTIVFYCEFNEGIVIMKSIIYKNRIISAILLCLFTLILITYLYAHNAIYFAWVIILLTAFLSRKILGNGTDLSNKEKVFLTGSVVVMLGVFLFFIYNITICKFINK